jgi:hypothetical protein
VGHGLHEPGLATADRTLEQDRQVTSGSGLLIEVGEPRLLRWRVETPSLEFEFDGTFELTPVGTDETTLLYRGTMRFSDRYAGPLDPLHADLLEEHLETVATRIAGRAARHAQAEQAATRSPAAALDRRGCPAGPPGTAGPRDRYGKLSGGRRRVGRTGDVADIG